MEKFCINKELLYFAFHLMPQVWKTDLQSDGQGGGSVESPVAAPLAASDASVAFQQ